MTKDVVGVEVVDGKESFGNKMYRPLKVSFSLSSFDLVDLMKDVMIVEEDRLLANVLQQLNFGLYHYDHRFDVIMNVVDDN